MKAMMKQMGMSQNTLDATEVIIKTPNSTIIFDNPQVEKVSMQGQVSFQVQGEFREVEEQVKVEISQEDIDMVAQQASVSKERAKKCLEETQGDIAQAIVNASQ